MSTRRASAAQLKEVAESTVVITEGADAAAQHAAVEKALKANQENIAAALEKLAAKESKAFGTVLREMGIEAGGALGKWANPLSLAGMALIEGANSAAAVDNAKADGKVDPGAEVARVLVTDATAMATSIPALALKVGEMEKVPFTNISIPPAVLPLITSLATLGSLDKQITGGLVLHTLEKAPADLATGLNVGAKDIDRRYTEENRDIAICTFRDILHCNWKYN